MLLIGLTGSIGMGKTETAKMFALLCVPVYDADAAVHKLYQPGGAAVGPIGEAFPDVVVEGSVDRAKLSECVIGNPEEIRRLEEIVHPLVGQAQMDFLLDCESQNAEMVLLDIPLLFETGGQNRVDVTVVVSAPYEVQRARVLARPGMTPEKFGAILKKQVPDEEKRSKADYVVDTSKGLDHAFEQVTKVVEDLKGRKGTIWSKRRAGRT